MATEQAELDREWNLFESLEKMASASTVRKDDDKEGNISVPVSGFPTILSDVIHFRLKPNLPGSWTRKSSANVHRLLIRAKLPWLESLAESHPKFRTEMAKALDAMDDTVRAEMHRSALRYEIKDMLWPGETEEHTIRVYCSSKFEASRLYNAAEDLGISISTAATLVIVAAIAWSNDEKCVPTKVRNKCLSIVKDFESKLEPWGKS